ncbi:MAG TPA: membrane dipeptidase [Candidatus Cloacimonadota bacterium]|nr:membrane dipeptidase [Candidatus Cloacimonadota bacterium]
MPYPVIDCHADTFSKQLLFQKNPAYLSLLKMRNPDCQQFLEITPERCKQANLRIQTQSLYMHQAFMDKPLKHALKIIALVQQFIKENPEFYLVKSFDQKNWDEKMGILLSIEGLEVIEENLDLMDVFYELGVRMIAPNWNRLTPWLSPVTENSGMLSRGMDLVKQLNQMNVLLDISHLSDQSVFDLEKVYQGTIIASHSNIRNLTPEKRNLSDDLIEIIRERQGLIGINFYPVFLQSEISHFKKRYSDLSFTDQVLYDKDYQASDFTDTYPVSFLWILNILEYLDKKNALDCVCFGADFDGIEQYSPGLENPSGFPILESFLRKIGCEETLIKKIFFENALAVLKRVL